MRTVYVTSETDGSIYAFRHSVPGLDILHPGSFS
jgi:hypothetical protein